MYPPYNDSSVPTMHASAASLEHALSMRSMWSHSVAPGSSSCAASAARTRASRGACSALELGPARVHVAGELDPFFTGLGAALGPVVCGDQLPDEPKGRPYVGAGSAQLGDWANNSWVDRYVNLDLGGCD